MFSGTFFAEKHIFFLKKSPHETIYRINSDTLSDISDIEPRKGQSIYFLKKTKQSYYKGKIVITASSLTLWKYGGIYLDLDTLCLKTLEDLKQNFAGAEHDKSVGSSEPNGTGHKIAELFIEELKVNFNGDIWGFNGTMLITRMLQVYCLADTPEKLMKSDCHDFKIFPPHYFYSVSWQNWREYFEEGSLEYAKNVTKDSYVLHVWNKLSYQDKIPLHSKDYKTAYGKHSTMVHLGVLNRKTKMKVFIVFAAALLAANALFLQEEWEQFKINYNKSHQNVVEETRFQIFKNNLKKINEHNIRYEVGLETYYMGVNQFADLTEKELGDLFRLQNGKIPEIEKSLHEEIGAAPESIDWRQKNAVLQVKNQGQIGTCWDFSATGALEGQNAILNNKKVALSEQELLDCSGGDMNAEFEYVRDNGLTTEQSYPYVGRQNKCNKPSGESAIKITGFKSVDSTETALKNAVGTVGPISAAVYIQPMFFYNGGIFSDKYCYNDYQHLEHGVLVVGYGTENGREYWIVKNSWGANWGEDGYFRLARNANQCGIALHASYPTL